MTRSYLVRILMVLPVLLILTISTFPAVPEIISYQGRLTDADGNPVPDGDYAIIFQIVEHDPMPMGESPLWSSGDQTVTVNDGLFVYYLGSSVPLPSEVFNDDALDSYFLRMKVSGSMLFSAGTEFVTVPFSVRSIYSDTAAYALAGPGGGVSGWVDDGSVVRLDNEGDLVGIGTATPSERLVVGKDMGSMYGDFVVASSPWVDGMSGFTAGYDLDNRGWFSWDNEEKEFRIGVKSNGATTAHSIYLANGNVGIGNSVPAEPLAVGNTVGSLSGKWITVGDMQSDGFAGVGFGQNEQNKGFLGFDNSRKEVILGMEANGVDYGRHFVFKNGNVGIGITPDSTKTLHIDRAFSLTSSMIGYGVYSKVHNIGVGSALMAGFFKATGPYAYGLYVVAGESDGAIGTGGYFRSDRGTGIYCSGTDYAGDFSGNVDISGTLSKSGGSFKIDHPLDPENKYLQHSFVESPDMMNIYNGNITLDENGEAVVQMPGWFDPLNRDFRYQLTCIGGFEPVYISEKMNNGKFSIAGGKPGLEVSWQVTGIRQDRWANEHRIEVEVNKLDNEKGYYRAPELYGYGEERSISHQRHENIERESE